jgi:hypothetical protein
MITCLMVWLWRDTACADGEATLLATTAVPETVEA